MLGLNTTKHPHHRLHYGRVLAMSSPCPTVIFSSTFPRRQSNFANFKPSLLNPPIHHTLPSRPPHPQASPLAFISTVSFHQVSKLHCLLRPVISSPFASRRIHSPDAPPQTRTRWPPVRERPRKFPPSVTHSLSISSQPSLDGEC